MSGKEEKKEKKKEAKRFASSKGKEEKREEVLEDDDVEMQAATQASLTEQSKTGFGFADKPAGSGSGSGSAAAVAAPTLAVAKKETKETPFSWQGIASLDEEDELKEEKESKEGKETKEEKKGQKLTEEEIRDVIYLKLPYWIKDGIELKTSEKFDLDPRDSKPIVTMIRKLAMYCDVLATTLEALELEKSGQDKDKDVVMKGGEAIQEEAFVTLEKKVSRQFKTINLKESPYEITPETIKFIQKFLMIHHEEPYVDAKIPLESTDIRQLVSERYADLALGEDVLDVKETKFSALSMDTCCDILLVANYLDCKPLIQFIQTFVGANMKGLTAAQIRKKFDITCDFEGAIEDPVTREITSVKEGSELDKIRNEEYGWTKPVE